MKLTYKKDKSFEFESKYVEIHIKVYMIPPTGHRSSLFGDVYTEFDVRLSELMDSQLSINNYTLNKFPELKQMHPYSIRIMVTDIKLYVCDLISDIIVPNVSWGLLPYEADLIQVKKSNLVVEYKG